MKEKTCVECGYTLSQFNKTGMLGCPKCYESFKTEIHSIIKDVQFGNTCHTDDFFVNNNESNSNNIDLNLFEGNIITSRVRLARNLTNYPFRIKEYELAQDIAKEIADILFTIDDFTLFFMSDLTELRKQALKERYLISKNLINNSSFGSVLLNKDENISVMINEEDIIREQCIVHGFHLNNAYERLSTIDNELCKSFDIAYNKDYGFLTACPTNLGTGLRASVMLFLPALTKSGKIASSINSLTNMGLTIRGIYGEGSSSEGCIYQVSNEITLGMSSEEIVNLVEDTVLTICKAERLETERIFMSHELQTTDSAKKAYGVLSNAVLLGYDEFLNEISKLKLGAMLGYIDIDDIGKLDNLIVNVRPANISYVYGKQLSDLERDICRADMVKKFLSENMR